MRSASREASGRASLQGVFDMQELSDLPDLIALSLVPRVVVCLAHSDALEALFLMSFHTFETDNQLRFSFLIVIFI